MQDAVEDAFGDTKRRGAAPWNRRIGNADRNDRAERCNAAEALFVIGRSSCTTQDVCAVDSRSHRYTVGREEVGGVGIHAIDTERCYDALGPEFGMTEVEVRIDNAYHNIRIAYGDAPSLIELYALMPPVAFAVVYRRVVGLEI